MGNVPTKAGSKIVRDFVEKLIVNGKKYVDSPLIPGSNHLAKDAVYTAGRRETVDAAGKPIRYVYTTDGLGRISSAHARPLKLPKQKFRPAHQGNPVGKVPGDHAGHLFANIFGGSEKLDNIVAQLDNVNLSKMKMLENDWAKRLRNGETFDVDIEVLYDGSGLRPTGFKITEILPDGDLNDIPLINNPIKGT